jgi:hypothetical protein
MNVFHGRNRAVAVVIASIPERFNMLLRAMESVRTQTLGPVETRIVIGMPRLKAYKAACEVDAEFVTWLDDDDYMLPDHLETLVRGQRATGADMVYTRSVQRTSEGQERIIGEEFGYDKLWGWDFIGNAFMYRTSLVREMGGFPSARKSPWGAIHFETARLGAKFHFVDHEPTVVVNVHDGNLTNKVKLNEDNPNE